MALTATRRWSYTHRTGWIESAKAAFRPNDHRGRYSRHKALAARYYCCDDTDATAAEGYALERFRSPAAPMSDGADVNLWTMMRAATAMICLVLGVVCRCSGRLC